MYVRELVSKNSDFILPNTKREPRKFFKIVHPTFLSLAAAGDGEARRGHGPLRVHRPRAQHGRAHQQLHLQTGLIGFFTFLLLL